MRGGCSTIEQLPAFAGAGHLAAMPSLHAHGLHPLGSPGPSLYEARRLSRPYAFFKNAR